MPGIPDDDLALIRSYCEEKTPPDMRDQMLLVADLDGTAVTISDSRPPWDGGPGGWTKTEVAQLRYRPATREWTLYWAGSDDRWHRYDGLEATPDVSVVLAEIEDDPTCIFWG